MSKNYTEISRPYDETLSRTDEEDINVENNIINSPSGIGQNVLSGQSIGDLWIENWIKSRSFKPRSQGFYLDGKTGYAEFSDVLVRGRIEATEGYFGDSTNGVQVDSTGLTLTGTGYIQTASSGARILLQSNKLSVFDTTGETVTINGGVTSGMITISVPSNNDSRGLLVIMNSTTGTEEGVKVVTKGNQPGLWVESENTSATNDLAYLLVDGDQKGLNIETTLTTSTADALKITAVGGQQAINIICSKTTSAITAAYIDHQGNGPCLTLNNSSNNIQTNYALDILLSSSHASRTSVSYVTRIRNGNKGGCLTITNASTSTGVVLDVDNAATTDSYAAQITQSSNDNDFAALYINKTSTGSGEVIKAIQTGTGDCIDIAHSGAGGIGLNIDITNNSNNSVGVYINKTGSGSGFPLRITNNDIIETNFSHMMDLGGVTIFISNDRTDPDTRLTGRQGDICFNGPGGVAYYCDTDGQNWTAM